MLGASLIYKIYRRELVRLTQELSIGQWKSREQLRVKCDEMTRRLAVHAKSHVPYYSRLFEKLEIDPGNMVFPDDWSRLPILDKEILKKEQSNLVSLSDHGKNSYINYSGGSTGEPVRFLTDLDMYRRMMAWHDLIHSWCGWKIGEMRMELWGNKEQTVPPSLWQCFRSSMAGRFIVPVYSYQEKDIAAWYETMRKLKPTVLYGYPSVLTDFAKWLQGTQSSYSLIKGIYTSAEILYPEQRQLIESVFGCKVMDQYGSRETPCVACECPEGNMHLFTDFNRVEFAENSGGEEADIIVTPLFGYAQPLIRYKVGDAARKKDGVCSCGRGYPMMDITIARSRDFLISIDGQRFYPGFFTRMMDKELWVRSFQFKQTSKKSIDLLIVPEQESNINGKCERLQAQLSAKLKVAMGGQMELSIYIVEQVAKTRAGKHRFVINEIQGNRDQ